VPVDQVPGVLLAAALSAAATACAVGRPPPRDPARVLAARAGRPARAGPGPREAERGPARPSGAAPEPDAKRDHLRRARVACGLAAVSGLLLLPLHTALPLAAGLVLAGPGLLLRLEPASARRERERLAADLPLLLDLLGACLAGGAALPAAAAAVGVAVPGPAGDRLLRVAAALDVGTPAAVAWLALAGEHSDDDPFAPAARTLSRAADSGAPVAAVLSRSSADARSAGRAAGAAAARRAGVLAVAPLGLCFLPAFVLLGVVPVVVGLAGPLLSA
jgi:Flp pilus assembly protein TadB